MAFGHDHPGALLTSLPVPDEYYDRLDTFTMAGGGFSISEILALSIHTELVIKQWRQQNFFVWVVCRCLVAHAVVTSNIFFLFNVYDYTI